jgi:hypothetical protein
VDFTHKIVEDTASGGKVSRSGLDRVLELLRPGDVLAVWRLDRLGRSLKHLIELMAELEGQGIGFQSVTEAIDTTTPGGTLVFHIFGSLAEFERNLIRERTHAGLQAARARGYEKRDFSRNTTRPRRPIVVTIARECVVRTGRSPLTSSVSPIPGAGRIALTCEAGSSPSEPRSHDSAHVVVVTEECHLKDNRIEDNGRESGTAGIRIRGEPSGLIFEDNVIRDTRAGSLRTQTVGIVVEERVGPVKVGTNPIEATTVIDDRRREVKESGSPQ